MVSVTATFGDMTSSGKRIKLTIPEGFSITQISTAGTLNQHWLDGDATAGVNAVDSAILVPYPSGSPQLDDITKMILPKYETAALGGSILGSTYGTLEVEIAPTANVLTISVQVRVDARRYYKPMTLPNPIKAEAFMESSSIGSVTQYIEVVGDPIGTGNFYNLNTGTLELEESDTGVLSTGVTPEMYIDLVNNNTEGIDDKYGTTSRYVKSAKHYLYYPEGTIFKGLSEASVNAGGTIENDTSNSRIIITRSAWNSRIRDSFTFTLPVGIEAGETLYAKDYSYVEVEYWDGTKETITSTYKQTVVIKTPDATNSSLAVSTISGAPLTTYMDASVANAYSSGGFFRVENSTGKVLKNQILEFDFGSNWCATKVYIPYDKKCVNGISKVEYKTNENSEWTEFDISELIYDTNVKILTKEKANLDEDEYFTYIRANVGDFENSTAVGTYWGLGDIVEKVNGSHGPASYGKLKEGTTSATMSLTAYEEGKKANAKSASISVTDSSADSNKTTGSNAYLYYYNDQGIAAGSVVAGSSFDVRVTSIQPFWYLNGRSAKTMTMKNPELYIRAPKGTNLNIDSIIIKDESGSKFNNWTMAPVRETPEGDKLYTIKTIDKVVGYYFGEEASNQSLEIRYTLDTDVTFSGEFTGRELFAWGKDGYSPVNAANNVYGIEDVYDLDGDENKAELLFSFAAKPFSVTANINVLVQTYLSLQGQPPKAAYVEGNNDTVAFFTPGTNADYTFKINNNTTEPAAEYTAYVPIPKTGENFGSAFQSEPFKWDMKLTALVAAQSGFEVSYSKNANADNFRIGATYMTSPDSSDWADINMVKITATGVVAPATNAEFKIPLNVDENFASATSGDKVGKRNVWNPIFDVDNLPIYKGQRVGTKAGAELVIAEIGGTVFVDKNADGLYKEADDYVVSGHEVELYMLNKDSGIYEPVLDGPGGTSGNQITTTTDTDGTYLFDHTSGLGYGTYAVRFVEKEGADYEYTFINKTVGNETTNSDAMVSPVETSKNADGSYRGWATEIDATKPVAKTIGCGFLAYNPPVDLKLDFATAKESQTVKVDANINVSADISTEDPEVIKDISPSFFDSIKDTAAAYTWELADSSDSQYVTLTNEATRTVNITGVKKTFNRPTKNTVTVRLTIKDIYGNTKSDTIEITVNTATAPTVTLPSTYDVYVGDTAPTDWRTEITSVADDNDQPITPSLSNTTVSGTPSVSDGKYSTPGTYGVSYTVTDIYGNEKTAVLKVKVNGVPEITAANQTYRLSLGDTAIDAAVADADTVTATYAKASDTIGEDATPTSITPSKAITAGGSDFSTAGTYTVRYTAAVASPAKSVTRDVTVNVVAPSAIVFDTVGNTDYTATAATATIASQNVYAADASLNPAFTVTAADVITAPIPPVKNGQTFNGWYYKASDVSASDSSSWTLWDFSNTLDKVLQVQGDTDSNATQFTLRAAYTYDENAITYNLGAGETNGNGNPTEYSTGMDSDITIAAPSKVGYMFAGWTVSGGFENDGTDLTNAIPEVSLTITKGSYGNIELTPTWTARSVAVNYVTNGGANLDGELLEGVYDGTLNAAPTIQPSKTGYTFAGWFYDSNLTNEFEFGTTTLDVGHGVTDGTGTGNATLTLYAKWTANLHNINFNAGSGTGAMSPLNIYFDETKALSANAFTKAGYSFAGWATSKDGSVAYADKASYKLAADSDIPLYAVWNANGNTAYKVEHYHVDALGSASLKETSNHTAKTDTTANATAKTYDHYTLNSAHSSAVASGNVAGDGSLVLKLYYGINHNVVSYSVTGTVPEGAPSAPAASDVAYGQTVNVAQALTFDGYTFSGWTADGVSGASFTMPDSDVSFTGSWTLVDNGGGNGGGDGTGGQNDGNDDENGNNDDDDTVVDEPKEPKADTPKPATTNTKVTRTPAPATPATAQATIAAAAAEQGIPTFGIGGNEIPLVAPFGVDSWSLANMLFMLAALVFAIYTTIAVARRRKYVYEMGEDSNANPRYGLFAITIAMAIASVVLFFTTQDLTQGMALVDVVSPEFVVALAVNVIAAKKVLPKIDGSLI
ncbi:MAG: InlB B-repeat-containing protein [Clostridiales Family XIII bacterium]|jgi:uncharacterized repeat protein (TIGR02543 family)|nr:InlB B-repeat-containing protein [Clostridiales Family XIII bacterium]